MIFTEEFDKKRKSLIALRLELVKTLKDASKEEDTIFINGKLQTLDHVISWFENTQNWFGITCT